MGLRIVIKLCPVSDFWLNLLRVLKLAIGSISLNKSTYYQPGEYQCVDYEGKSNCEYV